MLTAPSPRIGGPPGAHLQPQELVGCPFGVVITAVCPAVIPSAILAALHPEEARHAAALEGDRQREWVAGRLCLSDAVARLSADRSPLLPLHTGGPSVPRGLVGSISHKGPFTGALAGIGYDGVGIDVECA